MEDLVIEAKHLHEILTLDFDALVIVDNFGFGDVLVNLEGRKISILRKPI